MLHHDREKFVEALERAASVTGFYAPLMEKDYYLTAILSRVNELSEGLVFKGGTCLNKIYYSYYRLSEDLDFSMVLPQDKATRAERRQCIQPVKDMIKKFAEQFDMSADDSDSVGRNESKQYVYYLSYRSALRNIDEKIKFEIGLRFNPLTATVKRPVRHVFQHPFTGEPLFDAGLVNCLSLKEAVSEKLRAAALRKNIASRDFYDLDFLIRQGFDLADKEVMGLLQKKLEEDGADADLGKYRNNLGRSDKEIQEMNARIETELFDVLTPDERKNFDLEKALKRINKVMGKR